MSWYKRATIDSFEGPPKTVEEARERYLEGAPMVQYHALYDLARYGEWELVEHAMSSPHTLVKRMARNLLRKK